MNRPDTAESVPTCEAVAHTWGQCTLPRYHMGWHRAAFDGGRRWPCCAHPKCPGGSVCCCSPDTARELAAKAALERPTPPAAPAPDDWGHYPYDHKSIAEIVHDFAVLRGDLSEQYARDQLVVAIGRHIQRATSVTPPAVGDA